MYYWFSRWSKTLSNRESAVSTLVRNRLFARICDVLHERKFAKLLAAVFCLCFVSFRSAAENFSVHDAVEAEWYVSANGAVLLGGEDEAGYLSAATYSVNGRNAFFFVKSSDLEKNQSKLTLFLVEFDQGIFSVRELITLASETNSPPMYAARWISDDSIGLIGEYEIGERHILTVSLEGEIKSHYSDASGLGTLDVGSGFDLRGETVVFGTPESEPKRDLSTNENGYVVGTSTLSELAGFSFLPLRPVHYYVSRNGELKRLEGVSNPTSYIEPAVSISPSGRFVIVTTSPPRVPANWLEFPILDNSVKAGEPAGPLLVKLTLVNLVTGETFELTDAPMANPTELNQVVWDEEENRVFLIDQFVSQEISSDLPDLNEPLKPHIVEFSLEFMKVTEVIDVSPVPEVGRLGDKISSTFDVAEKSLTVTRGDLSTVYLEREQGWRPIKNSYASLTEKPYRLKVAQSISEPSRMLAFIDGTKEGILIHQSNLEFVERFNPARLYKWSDDVGRDWSAALTLPRDFDGRSRLPLIIQSHTFSPNEFVITGTRGSSAGFSAQPLASEGFAVLNMGFQRPRIIQTDEEFEVQAEGYRSAIQALAKDGIVDPQLVGVAGWSRSGFWLQKAMADDEDLFAAAIASDASSFGKWAYLFHHNWWASWQDLFLKAPKVKPFGSGLDQWQIYDPVTKIESFQTPLLITAYGEGRHIPVWWESYVAMKASREPVEYFMLPDTPHNPVQPQHKFRLQTLTIDWFKYWLLGIEDRNPEKGDQYLRWNRIRLDRCSVADRKQPDYCEF